MADPKFVTIPTHPLERFKPLLGGSSRRSNGSPAGPGSTSPGVLRNYS